MCVRVTTLWIALHVLRQFINYQKIMDSRQEESIKEINGTLKQKNSFPINCGELKNLYIINASSLMTNAMKIDILKPQS